MKTVFILGAGFSAPGGIPTLKDYFQRVEDWKEKKDSDEEEGRFKNVLKFEEGFRRIIKNKESDMETVFVEIDEICEGKGSSELRAFIKDELHIVPQRLRISYLYVISRTFQQSWVQDGRDKGFKGFPYFKIKDLYRNFIFKIMEHKATIITFNYDLIIDYLMMMGGMVPDYGFEITNLRDLINPFRPGTINGHLIDGKMLRPIDDILLLKLHGSLNWFKCRNESCNKQFVKLDIEDNWPTKIEDPEASSGEECPYRKEHKGQNRIYMDFLIIPPKEKERPKEGEKSEFLPFLIDVWNRAEEEIKNATKLVFIGYSFPPTDKEDIEKSMKEWINKNYSLNRIVIINKNEGLRPKYEEILGRYKNRIEYYPLPFEDIMLQATDSIFS